MKPAHIYAAVGILALALVGHAYVSWRIADAQAKQVVTDQQPIHQEAEQEKQTAVADEKLNQLQLAALLSGIAQQRQQPIKPVDYGKVQDMISAAMQAPAKVAPNPDLPDAPSATIAAEKVRNYILDCESNAAKLEACGKSTDNLNRQLVAEVKDHEATKRERDAYKKAAKGGAFWARLKGNAKWFVVGVAGGAALTVAIKH